MIIKRAVHQFGFSLLEIAIGLLILGLMLSSFTGLYQLIFNVDHEQQERENMVKIHNSINTFLLVNSYLPCPDTDDDGLEDRVDDGSGVLVCDDREGYLPYNDLSVKSNDAWGHKYYYRVNQKSENVGDINQICQSASVLGKAGAGGNTDLWLCPETNLYYCKDIGAATNCNTVCSETCINTIDPRPNVNALLADSPPFFHFVTPPIGSIAGASNLNIYHESASPYDGSVASPMGGSNGSGVVAVVVSWGANGSRVYRYDDLINSCGGGTVAENVNCANSRDFVDIKTGENRDFITWVTVNQAKMAIMRKGAFK